MSDFNFDPAHKDIRQHAASGFVFSGISQATKIISQFITVVVMARLLDPKDFGLVAMVTPIYAFAIFFHDLGLSQATMQRPNLTSQEVNSFFWINTAVGLAIAAILVVLSPLIGWFYHDPRTIPLIIAMAILVLLSGLGNQHGAVMVRRMEFRSQGVLNTVSSVLGMIGAIVWAYVFRTYWALYVGMAIQTVVPSLGVWLIVKWRPSWPKLAPDTGKMLKYGLGIAGGNLAGFLTQNINSVVIGRFLGIEVLGLYDRASRLLSAPIQQAIFPISGVIIPILYRAHDDDEQYRRTFLRTIGSLNFAIMPGVVWAIVLSDTLIHTLLGVKWQAATAVFAWLSVATIPQLINSATSWLMITQGRSQDYARWSLISGVLFIVALFIGLPFGILGVAIASVIVQFVRTPFVWWYACRTGPVTVRQVTVTLVPQFVGGVGAAAAMMAFRHFELGVPRFVLLAAGLVLAYVVAVGVTTLFPSGRAAVKQDIEFAVYILLRKIKKKTSPPPVPTTDKVN